MTTTKPAHSADTVINGVNVTRMGETIDTVKKTRRSRNSNSGPKITGYPADTTGRPSTDFTVPVRKIPCAHKPFVLDADEPPVLLGEDKGPNLVEYALTALISCMTTTMVYHAAAQGIKIEEIESTLEGDLDLQGFLGLRADIREGYKNIMVHFKVKSDASPEVLAALARNSPVFDVITNPVPVSVSVTMK